MIEIAKKSDAKAILDIYGPIIENTPISFETEVPSIENMEERIRKISSVFPFLVLRDTDGIIAGYAYASSHRERKAYRWSVDSTIYVSENRRKTGVGKKLYKTLFSILKDLGYYNVYAGITVPNEASISIHEGMGFKKIALYEKVGFKMGSWFDVGWWQLDLGNDREKPEEPKNFNDYIKERGSKIWQ